VFVPGVSFPGVSVPGVSFSVHGVSFRLGVMVSLCTWCLFPGFSFGLFLVSLSVYIKRTLFAAYLDYG